MGAHSQNISANTTKRPKRKGRSFVIAMFIFALGACIFSWPTFDAIRAQNEANEKIKLAMMQEVNDKRAPSDNTTDTKAKRSKDGDSAYSYLLDYNKSVVAGSAGAINDPWGIGSDTSALEKVGLREGIVGSLSIPRLHLTAPLYFGASKDHLANGVAVVSGTSAPLGQNDSNCVIAGHRGAWHGLPMFRDIEDIRMGDMLVIDTPWDTLTYKAVATKVISPDDVDAVKIQSGRDMVTLLTCHPYRHNYQRYLVYFERVSNAQDPALVSSTTNNAAAGKPGVSDNVGSNEMYQQLNPVNVIEQALLPSTSADLIAERWAKAAGLLIMIAAISAILVYTVGRWAFHLIKDTKHRSKKSA